MAKGVEAAPGGGGSPGGRHADTKAEAVSVDVPLDGYPVVNTTTAAEALTPEAGPLSSGVDEALRQPLLEQASDYHQAMAPCKEDSTHKNSWGMTVFTVLGLQMGWGLWLVPADFASLGWLPGGALLLVFGCLTAYSSRLFSRLYLAVPGTVLFGDVGHAAKGPLGRNLVYATIYSLDGTRCVVMHLAATRSLQAALPQCSLSLPHCALIVSGIILLLAQVRSLRRLSFLCSLGSACQLVAVVIVVAKLLAQPNPYAETELVRHGDAGLALVALMNIIFAYGGQFAYVEIISSMSEPSLFARACSIGTAVMTAFYLGVGAIGYASRGRNVSELVIFCIGDDALARMAASAVLVQALGQYSLNLNVWVHNILVLAARAQHKLIPDPEPRPERLCATDHAVWSWVLASAAVVAYSAAISVAIPIFSALVGVLTSVTYLTVAYTLPCWFALALLGRQLPRWERLLCRGLIPLSVCLSAAGLAASLYAIALGSSIG